MSEWALVAVIAILLLVIIALAKALVMVVGRQDERLGELLDQIAGVCQDGQMWLNYRREQAKRKERSHEKARETRPPNDSYFAPSADDPLPLRPPPAPEAEEIPAPAHGGYPGQ